MTIYQTCELDHTSDTWRLTTRVICESLTTTCQADHLTTHVILERLAIFNRFRQICATNLAAPKALAIWLVLVSRFVVVGSLRYPLTIRACISQLTILAIKHKARRPPIAERPLSEFVERLPLHFKPFPSRLAASIAHVAADPALQVVPCATNQRLIRHRPCACSGDPHRHASRGSAGTRTRSCARPHVARCGPLPCSPGACWQSVSSPRNPAYRVGAGSLAATFVSVFFRSGFTSAASAFCAASLAA